jgi:hypothetical protein
MQTKVAAAALGTLVVGIGLVAAIVWSPTARTEPQLLAISAPPVTVNQVLPGEEVVIPPAIADPTLDPDQRHFLAEPEDPSLVCFVRVRYAPFTACTPGVVWQPVLPAGFELTP